MQLTLMQIELVLHYYWSPQEHPYAEHEPSAFEFSMCGLVEGGMVERFPERGPYGATFKATEKAGVYVEAIRDLPLPVNQWVMPEGEQV